MNRAKVNWSFLCAMLWVAFAGIAVAQSPRTLSIPENLVLPSVGSQLSVPVNISDASGVTSYRVQVSWPATQLAFSGAANGTVIPAMGGWTAPFVNAGAGTVTAVSAGASPASGTGSLIILTFTVQPGASEGNFTLGNLTELNDGGIGVVQDDGSFTSPPAVIVQFASAISSNLESTVFPNVAVVLSQASAQAVMVNYAVTGGTALKDTDYALTTGTLTFDPGQVSKSLPIQVFGDIVVEPDETVVITLSEPANANLGGVAIHTYTILNDDYPRIQFLSTDSSDMENTVSPVIEVVLNQPPAQTATVNYAVTSGTATSPADYTLASGQLSFAAGQTLKAVPLSVVNDSVVEPDETVVITLSSPSNATLGSPETHTYTILNDDTVLLPPDNPSASDGAFQDKIVVMWNDISDNDGYHVYRRDNLISPWIPVGTVLGNGTTFTDQPLPCGESYDYMVRSYKGAIESANSSIDPGSTAECLTVQFAGASSSGLESDTSPSIQVILSRASAQTVTVNVVTGGTATSSADYTLASGQLSFTPGQTSKTLPLAIVNDDAPEPNDAVVLTLTSPVNAYLGSPSVHTYTILNDDVETITMPGKPTGEKNPCKGQSYLYTTSGATTNLGHPREFRFDWGDGSSSAWNVSRSVSHAWSTAGSKNVTVTARCQTHPNIVSSPSNSKEIFIQECQGPKVIDPNGGESWRHGSRKKIVWTYPNTCLGEVRIELWQNDSKIRNIKKSTVNDGKVSWRIKKSKYSTGSGYKVRIVCISNSLVWDESDSSFTISP